MLDDRQIALVLTGFRRLCFRTEWNFIHPFCSSGAAAGNAVIKT
jgi:hypothetical protein